MPLAPRSVACPAEISWYNRTDTRTAAQARKHTRKSIRYTERGKLGPATHHMTPAKTAEPTRFALKTRIRSVNPTKRHQPRCTRASQKTGILSSAIQIKAFTRVGSTVGGIEKSNRSAKEMPSETQIITRLHKSTRSERSRVFIVLLKNASGVGC